MLSDGRLIMKCFQAAWVVVISVQAAAAAVLPNYGGEGCQYQGETNRSGQPEGKGAWVCADGRSYTGQFKNGRFHGQGQYVVPERAGIYLEPFDVTSGKFKGMVLSGHFRNQLAEGTHLVFQNGEAVLQVVFEHGVIQSVTLPAKKRR